MWGASSRRGSLPRSTQSHRYSNGFRPSPEQIICATERLGLETLKQRFSQLVDLTRVSSSPQGRLEGGANDSLKEKNSWLQH